MTSPLTDLDELILLCRNDRAKVYIQEAVASYRAGAFRASIVSTWVAVCFDFIEKLHELSLAGDKEAEQLCSHLEKVRAGGDVQGALQFEVELLPIAKTKFEWLSPVEFTDLDRLKTDRNRCAHPSLVEEGRAYAPSAELARVHLKNAVTSVLQHPPAQGKYALDRLMRDVTSEYFPTKADDATASLEAGPLRKARDSLVRNFVIVLLKSYLFEAKKSKDRRFRARVAAALKATGSLHRYQFDLALRDKLSDIARNVQDGDLYDLVRLVSVLPSAWEYLASDITQKLNNFVRELPAKSFDDLDLVLTIPGLKHSAELRIKMATVDDLCDSFFFGLEPQIADRFVQLYLRSASFDIANRLAKEMIGYANDFSAEQISELILRIQTNPQVTGSFQLGPLINALRDQEAAPKNFDELLEANGLGDYVPE